MINTTATARSRARSTRQAATMPLPFRSASTLAWQRAAAARAHADASGLPAHAGATHPRSSP